MKMTTQDKLQKLAQLQKQAARYLADAERLDTPAFIKKYGAQHPCWTIGASIEHLKQDLNIR